MRNIYEPGESIYDLKQPPLVAPQIYDTTGELYRGLQKNWV